MDQTDKARQFAALHVKGAPVLLYNAWDAGSASAVLKSGARAIATSSWAVAAAQGYADGEDIPLEFVERIIGRITATIDAPVTADFEGGYSDDDVQLAANVTRLLDVGVAGINFEDRVVKGSGLYAADRQSRRIAAIRQAADKKGVDLFINARTDLFLGPKRDEAEAVGEAIDRAAAYVAAGASGFFVPGLRDEGAIARICEGVALPVNVMMMDGVPSKARLAALGVARISYGALPYVRAAGALEREAKTALA